VLTRVIQLIKSVFKASKEEEPEDKEEKDKKKHKKDKEEKKPVFMKALGSSEEYISLLKFFGGELPSILIGLCEQKTGTSKHPFLNVSKLP